MRENRRRLQEENNTEGEEKKWWKMESLNVLGALSFLEPFLSRLKKAQTNKACQVVEKNVLFPP